MIATELRVTGDVASRRFPEWIRHRAAKLDLTGWVRHDGSGALVVVVAGPAPLVDAMKMACSLGPVEVLVDRIESRPIELAAAPNGFALRTS